MKNYGLLILLTLVVAGCRPAEFAIVNPKDASLGTLANTPAVCDPFGGSSGSSGGPGIIGNIYSVKNDTSLRTSADYISKGTMINAYLFLSQLFVPTRPFSEGFVTTDGTSLKDSDGKTLVEYFGLDLQSLIQLDDSDAPGDYQFALLSDDGATFYLADKDGNLSPIVKNEGDHPTRLGCSNIAVPMTKGNKIPMRLTYYQGPRYHISLTLLWRPYPKTQVTDPYCGKASNDFYFDSTTTPSAEKAYKDLLARGWKPLKPTNFVLPDSLGNNKCTVK